jgi:uncharacterized protein involved in exopolysaccharide biosynthesis
MNTENRPSPAAHPRVRGIRTALRRHWKWMLGAWLLVTIGLMSYVFLSSKTQYDATSWLIVRASTPRIFDSSSSTSDFGRFQKTQVDLVTSPDVLGDALARHPEIAALPLLHGSDDPEAEIRRRMKVAIRPETNLIVVSLSSEDKDEAVAIIDAVVEAYLLAANDWVAQETKEQLTRLNEEARKLKVEIEAKRANLRRLVLGAGNVDVGRLNDQGKVSLERFQKFLGRLDDIKLRRIDLEAQLESARLRVDHTVPRLSPEAVEATRRSEFTTDPLVARLVEQKDLAQEQVAAMKQLAKDDNDTRVVAAKQRVEELSDKIEQLWKILEPELKKGLLADAKVDENDKAVQDLEAQVAAAKSSESALYETLKLMEIENKTQGGEALEVSFANAELGNAERLLLSIQGHVQQLEYETRGPTRVDKANTRTRVDPKNDHPWALMAAIPFVALGLMVPVLGLCALIGVPTTENSEPVNRPHSRLD